MNLPIAQRPEIATRLDDNLHGIKKRLFGLADLGSPLGADDLHCLRLHRGLLASILPQFRVGVVRVCRNQFFAQLLAAQSYRAADCARGRMTSHWSAVYSSRLSRKRMQGTIAKPTTIAAQWRRCPDTM